MQDEQSTSSGHRTRRQFLVQGSALAAASVGIAVGSGSDVALETAGAAILNNRIGDVAGRVRLARTFR